MKKHLQLARGHCIAASADFQLSRSDSSSLLYELMVKATQPLPQPVPDRPDPTCIVVSSSQSRQRTKYRPAPSCSSQHKRCETSISTAASESPLSSLRSSSSNTPYLGIISPQQQATQCNSAIAYSPTSGSASMYSAHQECATGDPRSPPSLLPNSNVKRRHRRSSSAPNLPSPKTIISYANMQSSNFVTVSKPQFNRSHTICANSAAAAATAALEEVSRTSLPAASPFSPRSSVRSISSSSTNLISPYMEINDSDRSVDSVSQLLLQQCMKTPTISAVNSRCSPKSEMRRLVQEIQSSLLRGTVFDASAAAGGVAFDSAVPASTNAADSIMVAPIPRKHIQYMCHPSTDVQKPHSLMINYGGEAESDHIAVIPVVPREITVGEELACNADWMAFDAAHRTRRKKSTVFTFEATKQPVKSKERK